MVYNSRMSKNHRPITKCIIAAAGTGTRFLPATKNQPKEMLPIIDKPIIHYQVEEAVKSGIKDIILVTRAGSHIMEDYFDNRSELEYSLEEAGKTDYLEMIREIPKMANFIYVRQKSHLPYGNGTPLLSVKDLIDDDESVVYYFGDDMTLSDNGIPVTKQLIDIYQEQQPAAIEGVQEVPSNEMHRYGSIKYKENAKYKYDIEKLIEKPKPEDHMPNIAAFGRFVFSYDVIRKAEETKPGKDSELWITDILNDLVQEGKRVIAQPVIGKWYTTGDPIRYLKTTLKFAMEREDLKDELIRFIKEEII